MALRPWIVAHALPHHVRIGIELTATHVLQVVLRATRMELVLVLIIGVTRLSDCTIVVRVVLWTTTARRGYKVVVVRESLLVLMMHLKTVLR